MAVPSDERIDQMLAHYRLTPYCEDLVAALEQLKQRRSSSAVVPLEWDEATPTRHLGRSLVGLEYEILVFSSPHFGSTPVQVTVFPRGCGDPTFHADLADARKHAEEHHSTRALASIAFGDGPSIR